MISFSEALNIVLTQADPLPTEEIPFDTSLGSVLAEDIHALVDMPPFDKSAVDGFAVWAGHAPPVPHAPPMRVVETIAAGRIPQKAIGPGECARIMTGAQIPKGADRVIMVEDTETVEPDLIRFTGLKKAANICYKGEDIRKGDLLVARGTLLRPQDIAVIGAAGPATISVYRKPEVLVISTGDELVPPEVIPEGASIRDSNSYQLYTLLHQLRIPVINQGIVKDDREALIRNLNEGLRNYDVTLLTGGVSMGDFDFVPGIMQEAGVDILFHSIAIQPGRPTVFGRKGNRFVFGLPGNPVSSFVQFELLVRPFLYKLMGHDYRPLILPLPLGKTITRKPSSRKSVIPVDIRDGLVFPVAYHGSAHIHSYIHATGILMLDEHVTVLNQGETVHVRFL